MISGIKEIRSSSREDEMSAMTVTTEMTAMIATTGTIATAEVAAEKISTRKTGSSKSVITLRTLAVTKRRGFLLLHHSKTFPVT